MRSAGCKAAAMEVSSHALVQERVRGVEFDAAIFTNLTQDHLDYHGTMEAYFEAKARLFTGLAAQTKKKGKAVINLDDRYGAQLVTALARTTAGHHLRRRRARRFPREQRAHRFQRHQLPTRCARPQLPRAAAADRPVQCLQLARRDRRRLRAWASKCATACSRSPMRRAVPGRLEAVPAQRQFRVFVDYAHTDDALLNVIKTCRELNPARLIVVFGCGGNRDKTKRPRMGAVVDEHADYAIVTSDNPRKEDPLAIIEDIKPGMKRGQLRSDRRSARKRSSKPIAMAAAARHHPHRRQRPRNLPGIRRPHRRRSTTSPSPAKRSRASASDSPRRMDADHLSKPSRAGPAARSSPAIRRARVDDDLHGFARAARPGDLFVALRGEKFDAHTFVAEAARRGAAGGDRRRIARRTCRRISRSSRSRTRSRALQQLAANYRRSLPLQVVGITGSNGKTSTKDLDRRVLGERFQVTKTEGNLNNHIGLPLTMLRARGERSRSAFSKWA